MGLMNEFTTFLKNYQVIGLAVAVLIGAAAGKLVSAFVSDLVMPVVGLLMPGGDWRTYALSLTGEAGKNELRVGDFLGSLVDFMIIAAVVFMAVKYVMKADATRKI